MLVNAITCCFSEQISAVVDKTSFEALLRLLEINDADLLLGVLDAIYKILTVYSIRKEECALALMEAENEKKIGKLVLHSEVEIYKKASDILNILHHAEEAENRSSMLETNQDIIMN